MSGVARAGRSAVKLRQIEAQIPACGRCVRLVDWCARVAREKRRAYAEFDYWGRPVPGFGDPNARLWIVGLAPGAHGANRTGRVFTGDRSGDFLFAALHRAGYANQPHSLMLDDGLRLSDCYISAAVRCAPPGNKPTPAEQVECAPWLDAEWQALAQKRVILALGGLAFDAVLKLARRQGLDVPKTRFGHGVGVVLSPTLTLLGSYHVSQQNTFTGRLTPEMLDEVFAMIHASVTGDR